MNILSLLNSFFTSLRELGLMMISPMYTLLERLAPENLRFGSTTTVDAPEAKVLRLLAFGGPKKDIVLAGLPMGEWD
ncbi:hypothetical protein [Desulfovibrio litoralis]|uniref:Uncharacterized protein n=1 Tax=Desulfovibrio litoralis DSM 11393 TaxID=1121455 RepID=A0A1M7T5T0_9BACT|nr:hypothetical protein [Desulfovibrio litoralis]SHN66047.1 hypothetical protein SAMN02745728_01570 [Desulfovibrio litoralis DSM 11393]